MRLIKSILNAIFNPIATIFVHKIPDKAVKSFIKKPYLVFLISLFATALIILFFYRSIIF